MTMQRLRRMFLLGAFLYALTCVFVALTAIATPPCDSVNENADVIIVLGAGVTERGTLPEAATERVRAGVALYARGIAPRLHISGGAARPGHPSEGIQMADLALTLGVGRAALSQEARSRSTLQNMLFSRDVLMTAPRILVVSEGFHLARSWASAKWAGADQVTLCHSTPFRGSAPSLPSIRMILREAAAIWFNLPRAGIWSILNGLGMERDRIDDLLI